MRSIDIHAHLTPQCFWRATENGGDWHTLRREQDANGRPILVVGTGRRPADLGRQLDAGAATGPSWAGTRRREGGWLEGLQSLSQEEKEKISWKNLEALLGI